MATLKEIIAHKLFLFLVAVVDGGVVELDSFAAAEQSPSILLGLAATALLAHLPPPPPPPPCHHHSLLLPLPLAEGEALALPHVGAVNS